MGGRWFQAERTGGTKAVMFLSCPRDNRRPVWLFLWAEKGQQKERRSVRAATFRESVTAVMEVPLENTAPLLCCEQTPKEQGREQGDPSGSHRDVTSGDHGLTRVAMRGRCGWTRVGSAGRADWMC